MIVDSHHHFWDPSRRAYPWMGAELDAIRRPYGPAELAPVAGNAGVERTVLVQTVSSQAETLEFLAIAERQPLIAGVIGWFDLTDPALAHRIDARRTPKLVGVRHQVHDEADPMWLLRDDVQRGLATVGEAGLVYDLLVRARELPAALETVRLHPDMRFVIDHAAKPRIAAGPRDGEWEAAMTPMAELPNVTCKLSGLVTEASWDSWTQKQLQPYVLRVLEWFGPERCMFGSDWPVCLLAASYSQVVDTIRSVVGDNEDVFARTALRVYRLAG